LEKLKQTIEAQNYQEEKKYVLRFSYGFSYNEKSTPSKSMYQLLEEADQQMYSQKKTRKRGI
jgi:GGDEF domain-containing protein